MNVLQVIGVLQQLGAGGETEVRVDVAGTIKSIDHVTLFRNGERFIVIIPADD